MVSTSDLLTIISLLIATLLGLGAIWATRRYNRATGVPDIEMGLLHNSTPSQSHDEAGTPAQILTPGAAARGHNLHEVISDALEVFSRHLRAHN